MRRYLASIACLFALCGIASACLNDSELPGHEREFRSSYKREVAPEPQQESPHIGTPLVLYGTGGGLLAGAGLMVLRRKAV